MSTGSPRLTTWQRIKRAFRPKRSSSDTKASVPGAQPAMETAKPLELPDTAELLKVHPNAPTWLIRARSGNSVMQAGTPDLWNTTLAHVPEEAGASQGATKGSSINAALWTAPQAADLVHNSPCMAAASQANILDTPVSELSPDRDLSFASPSRSRFRRTFSDVLDTPASGAAPPGGSLDSLGSAALLLSARGVLDTGTSILTTRHSQCVPSCAHPAAHPSSLPRQASLPPSASPPSLMKASARASWDAQAGMPPPAPAAQAAQQHGEQLDSQPAPQPPAPRSTACAPSAAAPMAMQPVSSPARAAPAGLLAQPELARLLTEPALGLLPPLAEQMAEPVAPSQPWQACSSSSTAELSIAPSWGSQSNVLPVMLGRAESSASDTTASASGEDSPSSPGSPGPTHSSVCKSNMSQLSMHDSVHSFAPDAKVSKDTASPSSAASISPQSSRDMAAQPFLDEHIKLPVREAGQPEDSLPAWIINPYQISFCSLPNGKLCRVGTGAFGTVYRGKYREQTVAVKVCKHACVNKRAMELFKKEVSILHKCRHPNIVSFIGACTWKGGRRTVLVTTFMEKGDLYAALGRHPARYCWMEKGRSIALDIAHGLYFLHSKNIVHFDLKSANILLNRQQRAQIADVGLAKTLTRYHNNSLATYMATCDLGTFAWSAPEVLLGMPCDAKADIYSFGVVLWELATCEIPVGRDLKHIRVPEDGPGELRQLINACLQHDPRKRPSAGQLVRSLQALQ